MAAVHVEALELLQATKGAPFQPVEARVVPQVQLLQIPQLAEGPCLNPCDVVGKQPQNLTLQDHTWNGDHILIFI